MSESCDNKAQIAMVKIAMVKIAQRDVQIRFSLSEKKSRINIVIPAIEARKINVAQFIAYLLCSKLWLENHGFGISVYPSGDIELGFKYYPRNSIKDRVNKISQMISSLT